MGKVLMIFFLGIIAISVIVFCYFFIGGAPVQKNIVWGVNFSQMQAESLKLDWKKNYTALLQDLGARNIKLLTQWDWIEGKKDTFYFADTDWQIAQAQKYHASIIYVVGMKTGRWSECHVPGWADSLSKRDQQDNILQYITKVVQRYKDSKTIVAWQAENEPLFHFGYCPWYDKDFLIKEVALIKSLDPSRPVIVSDSGEQSLWFGAAKIADILGVTMYRKAWFHLTDTVGFYFSFPLPPVTYFRKAQLVHYFFGKQVISTELQAEPWAPTSLYNLPLDEQAKTMDVEQFKANIAYAKQTGLGEFYLWGAEYWFWLKETHNKPEIWNEAKKLFIK